ncbi:antitoxin ParD1/3/4 [Rhizobium sp. BK529]|nr:antitoxin ParD1/3/4 [Rhizobium sp. BK529]TCR98686.1 antitoxin ParD1/3/4 [Rhizobium sp. BK418]
MRLISNDQIIWRSGGARPSKRPILPNFAIAAIGIHMSTMNISLPDHLKSFVDEQVAGRGYGTSSEYIRELIRRDQDRLVLRGLLVAGASSVQSDPADGRYFGELRDRVRGRHSK